MGHHGENQCLKLSSVLFVLCVLGQMIDCHAEDQERKLYVVYMGHHGENEELSSIHFNMLQDVVDSRFRGQSLIRSYTRSFNGFAAYLTHEEQEKLASKEEVVSIFPSIALHPQTTRSWDFMGLRENAKRNPTVESDTIVGVIDTGVWPESESFSDKGFSPPPKKWKGVCKGGQNFTCNNKLIGARYYTSSEPSGTASARDEEGHGSHTASTAAGNVVKHASFYGIANGTARGGVPSARIAAYKACFPDSGCQTADVLAAFDDAIADGVDIISISLGLNYLGLLKDDVIAIGSLHASRKGILVVQSAGNAGPGPLASTAPWVFTVAASTTDRSIVTKVVLGNGTTITGKAINAFDLQGKSFPLTYGNETSSTCNEISAKACTKHCLDKRRVNGKVVVCGNFLGIEEALNAGAVGSAVLLRSPADEISLVVPIPASGLSTKHFIDLEDYFNSTKNHTMDILKSELAKNVDAPSVASFSSRGPNTIFGNALKPDITAPGVEILAAFSPVGRPSIFPEDKRSVKYNILSGTSMACPHVAGAAAYVKSFHPTWSPSAIKSALMTTAWRMNATKDPKAEFSYGAGHIDPVKAVHPGLVYEILPDDYIDFLCNSGYDAAFLSRIFGITVHCPDKKPTSSDLNYPAMTFKVKTKKNAAATFSAQFQRTVTNVGSTNSTYKATTSSSLHYNITVKPSILQFEALAQKQSFVVTISGKVSQSMKLLSASLELSDGVHSVRSPIIVYGDYFYKS